MSGYSGILHFKFFFLLQVGWDESAAGERRNRVSMWEIEPITAPFFMCPQPFFGVKRPRQIGMSGTGRDQVHSDLCKFLR
jgi:hypothetical protein